MKQPSYLSEIFDKYKYIPKDTNRGELKSKELTFTHVIKGRGGLSILAQGIKNWNLLFSTIRFLPSLNQFKKALYRHLLALDS